MKKLLSYLMLAVGIIFLQSCSDDSNPVEIEVSPYAELRVNEICPKNATVIKDETGNAGDWIEIYNKDSKEVNLKGATIKYAYYEGGVELEFEYTIPEDVIIASKGYQVIWCDGKNEGIHTSFDLKTKKGGEVSILDENKKLIDSFDYSDSEVANGVEDVSIAFWAEDAGVIIWRMFGPGYEWWPTPGADNHTEIPIPEIQTIFLNEIMVKNEATIQDENGNYSDWIEIYNEGDSEYNLKGHKIVYEYEDNGTQKLEHVITNGLKIPAKSFQLIWCNNGDAANNYTGFDLKAKKGGKITILDPQGNEVDFKDYNDTDLINGTPDVSYGRKKDGGGSWIMFGSGYEKPVTAGVTNG